MEIGADQRVCRRRGLGDVAGDLRRRDLGREVGEGRRRHVAVLPLEAGVIDRAAIEPGGRARLEAAQSEAQGLQLMRE